MERKTINSGHGIKMKHLTTLLDNHNEKAHEAERKR